MSRRPNASGLRYTEGAKDTAIEVKVPGTSTVSVVIERIKKQYSELANHCIHINTEKESSTAISPDITLRSLEITNEKLVSIDFNHNKASSVVDGSLTNVVGDNMGKISAWYDNEWGFSNRMCDIANYLHKKFS